MKQFLLDMLRLFIVAALLVGVFGSVAYYTLSNTTGASAQDGWQTTVKITKASDGSLVAEKAITEETQLGAAEFGEAMCEPINVETTEPLNFSVDFSATMDGSALEFGKWYLLSAGVHSIDIEHSGAQCTIGLKKYDGSESQIPAAAATPTTDASALILDPAQEEFEWTANISIDGTGTDIAEVIHGRSTWNCTTNPWLCTDSFKFTTDARVECDADETMSVNSGTPYTFAQHWFLDPGTYTLDLSHFNNAGAFSCMEPTSEMHRTEPSAGAWKAAIVIDGTGTDITETIYGRSTWNCTDDPWLCTDPFNFTTDTTVVCDVDESMMVAGITDPMVIGTKYELAPGTYVMDLFHTNNAGAFSCEPPTTP